MMWLYLMIAFEAGFVIALIWETIRRERAEENLRKWDEYWSRELK